MSTWLRLSICCFLLALATAQTCAQDQVFQGFSEQRRREDAIRDLLRKIDGGVHDCFESLKDSVVVPDRGWTANWKLPGSLGAAVARTDTALIYRTWAFAENPLEGFVLMKNAGFYNREVNGKTYRYQGYFEWNGGASYRLVHSDQEFFVVEYIEALGYVTIDFVLRSCEPVR